MGDQHIRQGYLGYCLRLNEIWRWIMHLILFKNRKINRGHFPKNTNPLQLNSHLWLENAISVSTGKRGSGKWDKEEKIYCRRSKQKEVDKEGRRLLRILTKRGRTILNGNVKWDEEEEFTYVGKGQTVSSYVLVVENMRDAIESMNVEVEVGS